MYNKNIIILFYRKKICQHSRMSKTDDGSDVFCYNRKIKTVSRRRRNNHQRWRPSRVFSPSTDGGRSLCTRCGVGNPVAFTENATKSEIESRVGAAAAVGGGDIHDVGRTRDALFFMLSKRSCASHCTRETLYILYFIM